MSQTKNRIIKLAQELLLTRGYNGFSYNDIAQELNIKKASIHYYFAKKELLVLHYINTNIRSFSFWCKIQDNRAPKQRLNNFFRMYSELSHDHSQLCPLGVLGAEFPTLPKDVQDAMLNLLDVIEAWLYSILCEGKKNRFIQAHIEEKSAARLFINALSGALNTARITSSKDYLINTINALKTYVFTSDNLEL